MAPTAGRGERSLPRRGWPLIRRRRAARGGANALEETGAGDVDGSDVRRGKRRNEVARHAAQVDGRSLPEGSLSFPREMDEGAAAILLTGDPLDEAGGGHAVDEAREPSPAEEDGVGEAVHAQLLAGRLGELDEHVVPGKGQTALGLQLAFEDLREAGVRFEEAPPGGEFVGRGAFVHTRSLYRVQAMVARATERLL